MTKAPWDDEPTIRYDERPTIPMIRLNATYAELTDEELELLEDDDAATR